MRSTRGLEDGVKPMEVDRVSVLVSQVLSGWVRVRLPCFSTCLVSHMSRDRLFGCKSVELSAFRARASQFLRLLALKPKRALDMLISGAILSLFIHKNSYFLSAASWKRPCSTC